MTTVETTLYRVVRAGEAVLVSLSPISRETAAEYYWFEERDDWVFDSVLRTLPVERGTTQPWDSDVGSDDDLEWCWHDGDWLVTFIERERLAAADFATIKADAG
jgi:hypothetical protein